MQSIRFTSKMKVLLITALKLCLKAIYLPFKLFKAKNQIVFLSRQSNDKSIDMLLLERELKKELPDTKLVFRLRMIPDGIVNKIKYCFGIIGDMYFLATSRVAILDTYSITVSCLKHKKTLKVIQMWHASGAIKKFGLQSVGTKEGRDEKISSAMCMHKNYDYILAPSSATAKFYMQAFGYSADKIKICSLPRIDEVLSDNGRTASFYRDNPSLSHKRIIVYLPTFRDREESAVRLLKEEFSNTLAADCHLIVSPHPLFSRIEREEQYSYRGTYSTYDLMKLADVIITDYSACAFDAGVLMKPLYFYVPDYDEYASERGLNIDLRAEMPSAVFDNADELCRAIAAGSYDYDSLFSFKSKYMENTNSNNTEILVKFISMLLK